MFRKIISFCLMLFGLIGIFLEIGSYSEEGFFDVFGFVLACFFILIGLLVFLWPRIKVFASQRKNAGNSSKTPGEGVSSREKSFLLVTGIIELIIGIPVLIFVLVLGLHGIIAGEMGIMIGFFALALLIVFLPYLVLKFLMVQGLSKFKKRSAYLGLGFGVLYIGGAIFFLFSVPFFSLFFLVYGGFTTWAGIKMLKKINSPGIRENYN